MRFLAKRVLWACVGITVLYVVAFSVLTLEYDLPLVHIVQYAWSIVCSVFAETEWITMPVIGSLVWLMAVVVLHAYMISAIGILAFGFHLWRSGYTQLFWRRVTLWFASIMASNRGYVETNTIVQRMEVRDLESRATYAALQAGRPSDVPVEVEDTVSMVFLEFAGDRSVAVGSRPDPPPVPGVPYRAQFRYTRQPRFASGALAGMAVDDLLEAAGHLVDGHSIYGPERLMSSAVQTYVGEFEKVASGPKAGTDIPGTWWPYPNYRVNVPARYIAFVLYNKFVAQEGTWASYRMGATDNAVKLHAASLSRRFAAMLTFHKLYCPRTEVVADIIETAKLMYFCGRPGDDLYARAAGFGTTPAALCPQSPA